MAVFWKVAPLNDVLGDLTTSIIRAMSVGHFIPDCTAEGSHLQVALSLPLHTKLN